jgi:polyhydroxybutyrate depolymerase
MYKTTIIVICMTLFLTQFTPAFGLESDSVYGLGGSDVRVPAIWIEGDTEGPGDYSLGSGEYGRVLVFEGRERFYKIHVPPKYDQSTPLPVVLVFHGGGGYPDAVRYESGMDSVADQKGFIVVYPAGTQSTQDYTDRLLIWNDGRPFYNGYYSTVDDVGFISAVLDDLSMWFRVDLKRTYASGFSNGAQFTYRLAKQLSNRIAAIAVVAGHRSANELFSPPPLPMPVIQFSGKQDLFAPYYGGSPQAVSFFEIAFETVLKPVEETILSWVAFNQCYSKPVEVKRIGKAVKKRYGLCKTGAQVVLWTLEDGGHTWPGGKLLPAEITVGAGNINTDISASPLMWEFFSKYRRR